MCLGVIPKMSQVEGVNLMGTCKWRPWRNKEVSLHTMYKKSPDTICMATSIEVVQVEGVDLGMACKWPARCDYKEVGLRKRGK